MRYKERRLKILAVAALGVFATYRAADAHHSYAMFDPSRVVALTGTVKEFQWVNPHSVTWIYVDQGGAQVLYTLEGRSPSELLRLGWTKKTLKPGDKVKVTMHPLKDGRTGGEFVDVVLPDGRMLSQENTPSLAAPGSGG